MRRAGRWQWLLSVLKVKLWQDVGCKVLHINLLTAVLVTLITQHSSSRHIEGGKGKESGRKRRHRKRRQLYWGVGEKCTHSSHNYRAELDVQKTKRVTEGNDVWESERRNTDDGARNLYIAIKALRFFWITNYFMRNFRTYLKSHGGGHTHCVLKTASVSFMRKWFLINICAKTLKQNCHLLYTEQIIPNLKHASPNS